MRQGNLYDRGIVKYPNKYCFVFNEQYIELEGTSINGAVYVVVSDTEHPTNHKDIIAYVSNGTGKIAIGNLLQMLFNNPREQRCKYIHVDAYASHLQIISFHVYGIWGRSESHDNFACFGDFNVEEGKLYYDRHLVWFTNLPFSVPVFRRLDGEEIQIDGRKYFSYDTLIFDIPDTALPDTKGYTEITIERNGGFVELFDYTFDLTFIEQYNGVLNERIKLTPCCRTEGIYLRWIDRFGYLNHYLFDENEVSLKSKSSDNEIKGKENCVGRPVSIDVSKTITCAAISVNTNHQEYIGGIVNSPYVEMYDNDVWVPVTVESSIKENAKDLLRDLEISVKFQSNRQSVA